MARFKLPIFAVVVVVLALAGLMYLGGRLATLSGIQTTERLAWGQALFETSLRLAQSYRTSALAIAAADPALAETAAALKDAAPAATVADPVRKAVPGALERLPAALRRPAFFLVGNDRGVAIVSATGGAAAEVKSDPGAFRLSVAGLTGPQGTFALVDSKLYAVAAAPLRAADKNTGWLGAAFPLDDQFAAEQSKDLAMPVTLVAGAVVASSLPAAQRAAVGAAKDGAVAPLSEPPGMGPYFTAGAALATARSFALEGAEGARVVLVSESPLLASLADYQKRGIFAILAVLAAALAFFFVGKPEETQAPVVEPQPRPFADAPKPASGPSDTEAAEAAFNAFRESTGAPEPAPAAPPAPAPSAPVQPSAEAAFFDGAAAPPPQPQAPPPEPPAPASPALDPFAAAAPSPASPFEPPPPTAAELAESAASSAPTSVAPNPYDLPQAPVSPPNPMVAAPLRPAPPAPAESPFDPFADRPAESTVAAPVSEDLLRQAARSPFANEPPPPQAESTVVAQIPEELLRAARAHLARTAPTAATPGTEFPLAAPAAMTPEEQHFHEVFDQFVAMRSQCNEPADGLTYDKFAAKLRKNRDQLVVKYNCKAVRFQVYLKDGKAALKATPVRE